MKLPMRSSAEPATDSPKEDPCAVFFGRALPLARALRLRGEAIGNGQARIRMGAEAPPADSHDAPHRGAVAALLDCALGAAARSHDPGAFEVATLSLAVQFVGSGGGELLAVGHCERVDRATAFARGEARTGDGRMVAWATGTFRLVPRAL